MNTNYSQPKSRKSNKYNDFFYQKISPNQLFEFREHNKRLNAVLLWISLLSMIGLALVFYFLSLESLFKDMILGDIFNIIYSNIRDQTYPGIFLTSFLGGLFFLMFPLEIYYFALLQDSADPEIYFLIYYVGVFTAQSLNYWLGLRANRLCKIIIPPQKFYKLKGSLNRWGIWMILFMNALPLPSPVFSTVLGAFRYNNKRFLLFMGIGSFILYLSMYIIVKFMGADEFEELSWIRF